MSYWISINRLTPRCGDAVLIWVHGMQDVTLAYVREGGKFGVGSKEYTPSHWMTPPKTPADGDQSWHPISSLPKVGKMVLVWQENWLRPSQAALADDGWFYIGRKKFKPSYWREMPKTPALKNYERRNDPWATTLMEAATSS